MDLGIVRDRSAATPLWPAPTSQWNGFRSACFVALVVSAFFVWAAPASAEGGAGRHPTLWRVKVSGSGDKDFF